MGVTGMRGSIQTDLKDIIRVIKETTDTPVAIGFGIHTPKQAKKWPPWQTASSPAAA